MPVATGSRVGPYEILTPIGAGGMGEVFRARDTRLGRDVALKVLPTPFAGDADRLGRFEQEARAAAALNHPNILAVYDVGTTSGTPYVVSELLEGRTLREVLEDDALTSRKATDYGVQIATGLSAAHGKGIVHRDIKPENIFVTKDGRVKILDFGLAKLAAPAADDGSRATMTQTGPGMVVGTVGYMSPEQLRAEPVDARSDIFSLGAVLYEMFAGTRAFRGKTPVDTMTAILKEDPPDFPSSVHASAPAVERIVRRCLEKNVEERFQSVRDVTFALEALSSASGTSSAVALDVPAPTRPGVSVRRALMMAVAAGIVGIATTWLASRRSGVVLPDAPQITQLTFRSGTVRGARFAPDAQNVLYAAAWEGQAVKSFSTTPGSPDSTALNLPDADVIAVSRRTNELLVTLGAVPVLSYYTRGTLARASIAGGAPRAMLENVISADFSPDGQALAAIVARPDGEFSLQFPIGTERLKTRYAISHVRVAPDGEQLAFLSHPLGGDEGDVRVLGKTGEPRSISTGWISVFGLAWAKGGQELWFTASRTGAVRTLWAVTLDGHERLLYRSTESLSLEDVAPDGRALLSAGTPRVRVLWGALRDTADRDLTWFDHATRPTVSGDGKLVAYTESGEGAGSKYGIFVRPASGEAAVRVVDAGNGAISPDGRQVVAQDVQDSRIVYLVPTGAGAPKRFTVTTLAKITACSWFPDGRHIILIGNEPAHQVRSWRFDPATGALAAITAEGSVGRVVSPDEHYLAVATAADRYLLDLRSGSRTAMKGVEQADAAIGFTADSSAIYVFQPDPQGGRILRVDIATGTRTLVRTLRPADPSGLRTIFQPSVSLDGEHFAYSVSSLLSQLFLLKLSQ